MENSPLQENLFCEIQPVSDTPPVLDPEQKKCQSFFLICEAILRQYKAGIKVGYLGGGQLARMLAESASRLGLEPHVLSLKKNSPAAQVTGHWHQGSLGNENDLIKFLNSVDVASFESEFLNADKLIAAKKKTKAKIYPSPELMGLLQDRKTQKDLYDQNRLPTAPWQAVDTEDAITSFMESQKLPVVFKKRFFGYDGYGTFIIKTKLQLSQFIKNDFKENTFIVEKFIPFKKECAVIVARSLDGSFTHLPLVESFQKDARCDWVKGPMKNKESKKMILKIKSFLKSTHYVGVMGVEFFLTNKGLIINEVAPRVHNTGHYSLNTPGLSQFDLHNMCLLGQKLPKEIKIKQGFAMTNPIGSGKTVKLKALDGLYWYGKSENRAGRKMGHLNATANTPADALKLALKKRKDIQL